MRRFYSAHPDSRATWDETELNLVSPWYSATYQFDQPNAEFKQLLSEALSGSLTAAVKCQDNLKNLAKTPLITIEPTLGFDLNWLRNRGKTEHKADSLKKHIEPHFLWTPPSALTSDGGDLTTLKSESCQTTLKKIKKQAQIPFSFSYDPLVCFRALQIHMLKTLNSPNTFPDMEKRLLALHNHSTTAYFQAIKLILTQSHYVTKHAYTSMEPATWHPPTQSLIAEFAASEKGHDKLVQQSLDKIPVTTKAEVLPEIEAIIGLLRYCAEHHLLAFAILVEFFEREASEENNPIIKSLLALAPELEIHRGIQKHATINEVLDHDAVGFEIASRMGRVNEATVVAAIEATLLVIALFSRMVESIHRRIS